MSHDVPYAEMRLPDYEAARDKLIRIEYTLLFQLRNYITTGRATLGGPGSELFPGESNKYMGASFPEAIAAILEDLIPDGVLHICLDGNETPSTIKATDKGDYWWVGVAE